MPTGTFERKSPSSVAATPASVNATPGKTSHFSENRKSSKPIMEKRRRARINESLGQLKTLILAALKKDSSRHSKLEKADILEMTVKHLRNLQRIQMTAGENTDVHVPGKYRAGFSACVDEVTRFLSACEGVTVDVRSRLLGHLAACVARVAQAHAAKLPAQQRQQLQLYLPGHGLTGAQPPSASLQVLGGGLCKSVSATNVRPDAVKVFGGFQVMPTADGQFALLLPSAALAPWSGQSAHPSMAPVMSVVAEPQAATSPDSMWRPW